MMAEFGKFLNFVVPFIWWFFEKIEETKKVRNEETFNSKTKVKSESWAIFNFLITTKSLILAQDER